MNVSNQEQYQKLTKNNAIVVFKFGAKWCRPCKIIDPQYLTLSQKYPNVVFCTVDMDNIGDIEDAAEISTIPAFLVYVGGEASAKLIGANINKLEELISL